MESWNIPEPSRVPAQPDHLRLHDTSSGQTVSPGNGDEASMYVCGITPYDATHLGHANTYVTFDLLNRYWRVAGHDVRYVQNVTDVDDPLLERADHLGIDWRDLAKEQTDLFRSDMTQLNVIPPDHYVGATETVDWVIEATQELLNKGVAYRVPGRPVAEGEEAEPDGDIYFSIDDAEKSSPWHLGDIGALSHDEMVEVFPERGGDPDRPGKRNPLDPLLWRVARPGEPVWEAGDLGDGRPGWHLECSAIARKLLPEPFTVNGGGADLRFPHHEFSAAHATAADGNKLANLFVHSGMVGLDGVKMSKSLGNLVLVSNLVAEGVSPVTIRTLLLNHHYRSDWSFTREELQEQDQRIAQWREALKYQAPEDGENLLEAMHMAMSNDLNAPLALSAIDHWQVKAQKRGVLSTDAAVGTDQKQRNVDVQTAVEALLGLQL